MPVRGRVKLGSRRGKGTMGTFAGVFTPSVLTILGIILFLRLGYIVGSSGLSRALIIIALANAISVLTGISLSAIATNMRVKGGGDYYIISRTLGMEFGGAIGLVLFLAQSVSIAFYCIGFGEIVTALTPWTGDNLPRYIAAAAIALLFVFAWLGADWATRFQFVVMSVLALALVSFFVGGLRSWDAGNLAQNWSGPSDAPGFWVMFAIFFPAVTGFTQGVSMSGELKDPGKSLPRGTLAAVGISSLVYFGVAVVLAGGLAGHILASDYNSMGRIAWVGWLIAAGVVAATLSSAMASFLGAPRILQALAADRIFPFLRSFAAGTGATANPRRGVLLSTAIAFITVSLGNLNLVAPVVSMFFLISYGLLNYATFFEARAASPYFRPRIRWFDKRLSLLGALGCVAAMLAVNPSAGLIGLSLLFAIHQYLKRAAGPARWADSSRSYLFGRVRTHLLSMDALTEHPRDWRPQILAFSKDAARREQILRFASWIEGGSGLTTAVAIIEGEGSRVRQQRSETQEELRRDIRERGLTAFALAITAPDLYSGLDILLQSYGVGPLRANIVLLNWREQAPDRTDAASEHEYGRYLREAIRRGCNLVVLHAEEDHWKEVRESPLRDRRIDVWWWDDATSHLMLLLSYLMKRSEEWEDATIRVIAPGAKKKEKALEKLRRTLTDVRIEAEPEVLEKVDADILAEHSRDAALVFLPLRLRGTQPRDPFGEAPENILSRLGMVAFVTAAEDIELAAEPDEGKPAEIAEAAEDARRAEKAARQAEETAVRAEETLEKASRKLEKARAEPADEDEESERQTLDSLRQEAESEAKRAGERARRARAKADKATEKAASLGVAPPSKEKEADREPPGGREGAAPPARKDEVQDPRQ